MSICTSQASKQSTRECKVARLPVAIHKHRIHGHAWSCRLGAFLTSNPKNLLVATLTSRKQKQIQELVMLLQLRKACRDLCAIRKQLPYIYSMEYRLPGCNIALANSSKTAAAAVINEAELLKPEIAARVASFLQAKYAAQEHASVLLDPGFYEPFASREVLPLLQGYLGSIANIASASDEELSRVGYYLA
jgi:hypothetical protein